MIQNRTLFIPDKYQAMNQHSKTFYSVQLHRNLQEKVPSLFMESRLLKKVKPYVAIIFLQFCFAVFSIISDAALKKGMNHFVFSVYRNAIATIVFSPFALLLERNERPRMTFSILFKILFLGLLEPVIDQNLYFAGMKYTTATFTTAMTNIVPAITFLLAWMLRLERVNVKKIPSQAKIFGTLVTVGGTMIMTLVQGRMIELPWTNHKTSSQMALEHSKALQNPIKGVLMIAAGCFCWSIFYNLQAIVLKSYPAGLSVTAMICLAGALQGTVLTLIVERGNYAVWSVNWDVKLLAYVYGGVITSGFGYYVSGGIMEEKGPVFVSAFSPLSTVIVAIMSSIILHEQLQVGKVIGAAVIVCGLYLVVWGKSKDQAHNPNQVQSEIVSSEELKIYNQDPSKDSVGYVIDV